MPGAAESPTAKGQDFTISHKQNITRTITASLSHSPIRRGLLTSRDKEFLSILSYVSKNGICQISHQELALRMGHCKPQAITKRLQRLERLGHLKREGNHRNQKIHLFQSDEDHDHSITIPEHIWIRNDLSSSQKLLITIILAFPKVKAKNWTWWPDRIGMNHQSYKLNLRKIIFKIHPEPYKTLYRNPIRLYKEPYKTLYAFFGIGGEGLGSVNNLSDYKGTSSPAAGKPSHLEDNKNMLQNIGTPQEYDYRKAGYLRRPVRPQKKTEPIPDDIMVELQEEIFPHKHLATHRTPRPMAEAARIVKALRKPGGLSNILDRPQIEQIISCLSTGPAKLDPRAIEMVLHKQFNDDERIELYQRISDSMSQACGGEGGTIGLVDAVYLKYGNPGFSRLVKVWIVKPKPKIMAMPTIKPPLELQKAMEMCKAKMNGASDHNIILKRLRPIKTHWDNNIIPKLAGMYKASSTFEAWLGSFLEFAYNKATREWPLHAGWLSTTAPTFQEWEMAWLKEMEFESEQRRLGDQARESAKFWDMVEAACDAADVHGEQVLDDPAFGFDPRVAAEARRRGMYGYR